MLPIRGTMPIQSQKTIREAEQEFVEDWLEQETTASANFFSQVDQLWSTTTPVATAQLKCESSHFAL